MAEPPAAPVHPHQTAGAEKFNLALGQHLRLGVESDLEPQLAALHRLNQPKAGTAGLQNTDQIAVVEDRSCQGISPRD
jgi:hypothetical protein